MGKDIDSGILLYRICHGEFLPWLCKIQGNLPIRDLVLPVDFVDDRRDDIFGKAHHVVEVVVHPVDLHHGELRVVVGIHTLVPEVPGDLKDLLESSHNETFEVEFGSNPQEEFLVEEVVVGGERTGICTPVHRLENGGLELQEPVVIEEPADQGYNPAPVPECLPALLVGDEIDVPLAVPFLHIREPVEFLGKRADRFAQQGKCVHPDGDLTQFCPEDMAGYPDDVPPLDVLVEELELLFPEIVLPDVELDLA